MVIPPTWTEVVHMRTYDIGEYVFKEGDPGDELCFIVEGQVAIIKDAFGTSPLVLNFRGAGDMIGEIALLANEPRSASVLVIEETTMQVISREAFWQNFDEDAAFRQSVMRTVISRLLAADESRMQTAAAERDLFNRLSSIANENERLAEVMQLRQETMRFIVHDLRNPLNLVMMALSLIEDDEGLCPLDADSRRFLALASGGVRRMFALVESLLDVERLDSGDAVLNLEPLDLIAMVDTLVEQHRPLAWASEVEIACEHGQQDRPIVVGDRIRLERVLVNLLDNAVKFSRAGRGVHVTTACRDDEIQIAIEDSGPGIPREQRGRVFDRFVQLDGRAGSRRGFGLGLAFCRSAITAHGGQIWVEDGQEGGARFVFSLPVGE